MILCDRDIRARIRSGSVKISPSRDVDGQIRASSVDLLLGHDFRPMGTRGEATTVPFGLSFLLVPGAAVLATTFERLELPLDLAARVEGRATFSDRWGVLVHASEAFIDAGYTGNLVLEIVNLSPETVRLVPRTPICRLTFQVLTSHAEHASGEHGTTAALGASASTGIESGVVSVRTGSLLED